MSRGIKRLLRQVSKNIYAEISEFASQGRIAGAMASEGYNGGYWAAIQDVILALNGVHPNRNGWWPQP